ncbi:MAG: RES family NAD+ phosphorylase [Gemmatimonadaceae bacterium]|nr:RES family NAD+ phosphorylase [Gemmatimonadaceae bacterium]
MTEAAVQSVRVRGRAHRLVPSRFPPVGVFDRVATPADAIAAMELESLTNDRVRIALERSAVLPEGEWVVGVPGATIVMAAFLHAAPGGGRFNAPQLGAWYGARDLQTAIRETIHHHSRRLAASDLGFDATITMRELVTTLDARLVDLRGRHVQQPALYHPDDYTVAQQFGEACRARGDIGIVWTSVRRSTGECVVIYRPRALLPVTQGRHLEYRWHGRPEPEVLQLESFGSTEPETPRLKAIG